MIEFPDNSNKNFNSQEFNFGEFNRSRAVLVKWSQAKEKLQDTGAMSIHPNRQVWMRETHKQNLQGRGFIAKTATLVEVADAETGRSLGHSVIIPEDQIEFTRFAPKP